MNIIKKIARKLLFPKKKTSTSAAPFTTAPATSVNAIADPVISFTAPKVGGHDVDDKPKVKPNAASNNAGAPQKKKSPGRPKGQTAPVVKKKPANTQANKSKPKPKANS